MSPQLWTWVERSVDPTDDHLELEHVRPTDGRDYQPILVARVGRPSNGVFPVQFLIDKRSSEHGAIIADVVRQLDFFLVDKRDPDPWMYARHHCGTAANIYSAVHWSFREAGDPKARNIDESRTVAALRNRQHRCIDLEPAILAGYVARTIERGPPNAENILELQRQLLTRHATLPHLKPPVSSEEVVESFFRCVLIDYLQRRFKIKVEHIPECINSSHAATRRVCAARSRHSHDAIEDSEWVAGWHELKGRYGERTGHADLYLVARNEIVSLEFKYVGPRGLSDLEGCAAQMNRYADSHAATILVLYSGSDSEIDSETIDRLRALLRSSVIIARVRGPAISPVASNSAARRRSSAPRTRRPARSTSA